MSTISVQEIQNDPAGFLHRVEAGESLLVLDGERAVAEVNPLPARGAKPRPAALAAGEFHVPDDFDAPLPESIIEDFEG